MLYFDGYPPFAEYNGFQRIDQVVRQTELIPHPFFVEILSNVRPYKSFFNVPSERIADLRDVYKDRDVISEDIRLMSFAVLVSSKFPQFRVDERA